MSRIFSLLAIIVTSIVILATTANANTNPFIRMDCDNVFYATTNDGYEQYHNLSIEGKNIIIHVDRIRVRGAMANYVTIITDDVFKLNDNERVEVISGTLPQCAFYSLVHVNRGTSTFFGEVQDDEMEGLYRWIAGMKNNQMCDLAIISSTGKHHYTRVGGFKNTSVASRCVNDIRNR